MSHHCRALRLSISLLFVLAAQRAGAQVPPLGLVLLPAFPTPSDRLEVTITGPAFPCIFFGQPPQVSGNSIRIDGRTFQCPLSPPTPLRQQFVLDPLAAGTYTVTVFIDQTPNTSLQFRVLTPTTNLLLSQSHFLVRVTWQDPRVGHGSGFAQPLAEESGYFWFFASSTAEIFVKILDGRAINGHFWVFMSSMTDVGFTATVFDISQACSLDGDTPALPPCPARTYVSQSGRNQNFIDTNAF